MWKSNLPSTESEEREREEGWVFEEYLKLNLG